MLTIQSTSGVLKDKTFNANEPVRAVKVSSMAQLKIDPSAASKYRLVLNGQPLPEDKTLVELNVPNGATLTLELTGAEVI